MTSSDTLHYPVRSRKPQPSALAIAVVFGGTIGLTTASLMEVSGGGGFLFGTTIVFIALSFAILINRARHESQTHAEQLRELVAFTTKYSAGITEDLPGQMIDLVRSQEKNLSDNRFVEQIASLDVKLEEVRVASEQLHDYKARPVMSIVERTAEIVAISAIVITALKTALQLVQDLSEFQNQDRKL